MSYSITTDIFCDGPELELDNPGCVAWVQGAVGRRVLRAEAWKYAADNGWKRINGRHYCPCCAEQLGL